MAETSSKSAQFGLGSASARSTLLTVLGEYVLPSGAAVWSSTLVAALAHLDVEEKAARQAMARLATEGLIESQRVGRRMRWQLTDAGATLLHDGANRIYGFLSDEREWDGRWLVVSIVVPERQRAVRHHLKTRLTWLGMGSPSAGLWVVPDASKQSRVVAALTELGLDNQALVWCGPWAGAGDVGRVVDAAWELDALAQRYRDFTRWTTTRKTARAVSRFRAQIELVHEWRRFPFLDPELPPVLLPQRWPGPRAARAFGECRAAWYEGAQQQWQQWCAQA